MNLLKNSPITLVDVGASGGVHKRWNPYKAVLKSILFEPDTEEYKKLIANNLENTLVINSALAEKSKMVDFNICKWQQVSSIYAPNHSVLDRYEDSNRFEIDRTITIEADSIDNLLQKENVEEIDFIKIDTQGSELDILKGATKYFESLIGIEVEVEFIELYQKQPLFSEVNKFIESKGFSLIDLRKCYWKRKGKNSDNRKGQLIYADALYLKEPENIVNLNNIDQEKIIKSIYIYLAYGYHDLALSLLSLSEKNDLLSEDLLQSIRELLNQHEREYVLPNFKGKQRIKDLIYSFGDKFSTQAFSFGTDSKIGN